TGCRPGTPATSSRPPGRRRSRRWLRRPSPPDAEVREARRRHEHRRAGTQIGSEVQGERAPPWHQGRASILPANDPSVRTERDSDADLKARFAVRSAGTGRRDLELQVRSGGEGALGATDVRPRRVGRLAGGFDRFRRDAGPVETGSQVRDAKAGRGFEALTMPESPLKQLAGR